MRSTGPQSSGISSFWNLCFRSIFFLLLVSSAGIFVGIQSAPVPGTTTSTSTQDEHTSTPDSPFYNETALDHSLVGLLLTHGHGEGETTVPTWTFKVSADDIRKGDKSSGVGKRGEKKNHTAHARRASTLVSRVPDCNLAATVQNQLIRPNKDLEDSTTVTYARMVGALNTCLEPNDIFFYSGVKQTDLPGWKTQLDRDYLANLFAAATCPPLNVIFGEFNKEMRDLQEWADPDDPNNLSNLHYAGFWTMMSRAAATHAAQSRDARVVLGTTYNRFAINYWNTVEFPILQKAVPAVTVTAYRVSSQNPVRWTEQVIWPLA